QHARSAGLPAPAVTQSEAPAPTGRLSFFFGAGHALLGRFRLLVAVLRFDVGCAGFTSGLRRRIVSGLLGLVFVGLEFILCVDRLFGFGLGGGGLVNFTLFDVSFGGFRLSDFGLFGHLRLSGTRLVGGGLFDFSFRHLRLSGTRLFGIRLFGGGLFDFSFRHLRLSGTRLFGIRLFGGGLFDFSFRHLRLF